LDETARRFGLETKDNEPKPALIYRLEQFFASAAREGRRAVLFLDEAHLLTPSVLEEVRLLSNLRCEGKPPLLICLVGQPELARRLKGPRLRQLRQRISVRYAFKPLSRIETQDYLAHRLQAAGSPEPKKVFLPEAAHAIYESTRGVPREINVLAGQAMLNAYLEGARQVLLAHVVATRSDYGFEGLGGSTGGRDTPDLPFLAMADAPPRDS
jgi:MSHA biogenesis protein MshM